MMNNQKSLFLHSAKNDLVPQSTRTALSKKLFSFIDQITENSSGMYDALFSARDTTMHTDVTGMAHTIQKNKPSLVILFGIGGSHLAPAAIIEFIFGSLFNSDDSHPQFYCVDTVDTEYLSAIKNIFLQNLKSGNAVLLIVISKSGITLETIVNFSIFFDLLQEQFSTHVHNSVVIISDKNSPLFNFGINQKMHLLEIPATVGGRYSVFTPVGLFPAAFFSIDIKELTNGADAMLQSCLEKDEINPALYRAITIYYWYTNNLFIHDFFSFSLNCTLLGAWYRQLIAESLGKKRSDGTHIGIVPTVSIGSRDLHSMFQLSIDGPLRTGTTFLTVKDQNYDIHIPQNMLSISSEALTAEQVMRTLSMATKAVYQEKKLPFLEIELETYSLDALGQLFQCFMIETIFLATLFNIDPFNQPAVELYKKEAHKLMRK